MLPPWTIATRTSCRSHSGIGPGRLTPARFAGPRLYWISWELNPDGADVDIAGQRVTLTGHQPWTSSVEAGWAKVDENRPFPTFTTSRPRTTRGHRPAGLDACDQSTISRWEEDLHRFPPYQYIPRNCLVNKRGEYRLPNIRESEYMMGLPIGYTQMSMPKSMRKHIHYHDKRLTLVGNAWAVPVVAWLLGQLVGPRGAGPSLSPAEVLSRLTLEGNPFIQSRLMRPPLQTDQQASGVPTESQRELWCNSWAAWSLLRDQT